MPHPHGGDAISTLDGCAYADAGLRQRTSPT